MASDQLRCPLCSKWLCTERQPRLLNCGHSFCIECLHQCPVFDDYSVQLNHQTQNRGDEIAADKTAGDTTTSRSSTTTTTEQKSFSRLLLQALGFQGSTTSASPAQDETTDDTSNETNESREHPIINAEASSNMVTARPTGGHIKCLVCREPTQLSSSSADPFDEMETNEMLALAADRYAAMLSVCGDCNEAESEVYCDQCKIYLCDDCNERIHSGAITGKHSCRSIDSLGPKHYPNSLAFCPDHPKEELVLFCISCRQMSCVLCAYGDHKAHRMSLLTEAAADLADTQLEQGKKLEAVSGSLLSGSLHLRQELNRLRENAVAAKAFLGSKIQELLDSIHSYNKNILAAIDEEVEEKERSLRRQMVDLDTYGRDTLLRARLLSSIIEDCPPNVVVRNCLAQAPVIDAVLNERPSTRQQRSANIYVSLDELARRLDQISIAFAKETFPRTQTNQIKIKPTPVAADNDNNDANAVSQKRKAAEAKELLSSVALNELKPVKRSVAKRKTVKDFIGRTASNVDSEDEQTDVMEQPEESSAELQHCTSRHSLPPSRRNSLERIPTRVEIASALREQISPGARLKDPTTVGTAKSHDESLPVDKVSVEIRTGRQRQLKRTESTTSSSSIGTTAVYNDTGALAAAITSSKPSAKTSVKKPARAASNDRVTTRRTRQLPATAAGSKLSLNHVDLTLENMPPVKLSAASSEPIVPEKTVQEKENTLLQQEPPLKQTAGLQSQFKLMDDDDFAADDGDSSDFPPADAFWKRKPLAAGISASQPAMSSSSATAAGGTAVKTGSSDGRFVDLSFLKKP